MINMTKDKTMLALKESKFYQRLLIFNTVAIALSGSRGIGVEGEYSDYDIVVITNDERVSLINSNLKTEYLLTKDGKKIHWYYWYYGDYSTISDEHAQNMYQELFIIFLNDENIIEIFDQEKYDNLVRNKERIFLKGVESLYRKCRKSILDILSDNSKLKLKNTKDKILYRLYFSEMILSGEELDKEFLKRIKSLEYSNEVLSDDELNRCYNLLLDLKNRFEKD